MTPDPQNVARVKQPLILSMIAIVLTGCSLSAGRDVRAYNACVAALCEGPRQAYRPTRHTAMPLTPSLSPRAGRGRDPWRIQDAPPDRRSTRAPRGAGG